MCFPRREFATSLRSAIPRLYVVPFHVGTWCHSTFPRRAIQRLYAVSFHVSTPCHATSVRRAMPRRYVVPFHVGTSCHFTSLRRAVMSQGETPKQAGLGDAPTAVLGHDDSVVYINQRFLNKGGAGSWGQNWTKTGGIG